MKVLDKGKFGAVTAAEDTPFEVEQRPRSEEGIVRGPVKPLVPCRVNLGLIYKTDGHSPKRGKGCVSSSQCGAVPNVVPAPPCRTDGHDLGKLCPACGKSHRRARDCPALDEGFIFRMHDTPRHLITLEREFRDDGACSACTPRTSRDGRGPRHFNGADRIFGQETRRLCARSGRFPALAEIGSEPQDRLASDHVGETWARAWRSRMKVSWSP